jgi:histidinol-phosphate phosphatase family protein
MYKAVFLDRDGTLNFDNFDYIKNLTEFRLFPDTIAALQKLQAAGYKMIVITNQACVAKGLTTVVAVEEIHHYLKKTLADAGVSLTGIYYCPHHPDDNCDCRKPRPGNVLRAAREHDLDLKASFFIGDSHRDVETGYSAGCQTILVQTGVRRDSYAHISEWPVQPDYAAADLPAAVALIEQLTRERNL